MEESLFDDQLHTRKVPLQPRKAIRLLNAIEFSLRLRRGIHRRQSLLYPSDLEQACR